MNVPANISENISRIINIDLSPKLYHLPIPSTVAEAIELRKRPEIVSFRKIFFEWCKANKEGDIDMTKRIKSDINMAQKELDKYISGKTVRLNCLVASSTLSLDKFHICPILWAVFLPFKPGIFCVIELKTHGCFY